MSPEDAHSIAETLKVVSELTSSKPNEWLPLYAALGGAIAGAIASFFPTWLIERRREAAFAKQIESCLLAEISALVEIVDRRGYLSALKDVTDYLRQNPEGTYCKFAVDVPSHYSRVYQDNCKHIGVVRSDIAQEIIVFHQLVDAVVQDMKPNGVFSEGATLETFEEMEVIFGEAMDIARKLLQKHNQSRKAGA
ncbi:hypothetical protein [Marinobacter sp. BGYM27]|uniref:hypothetical protein n=1 Tax=Marinobacter sp. BGYM27 TaxID=2975597 RepID=UPI0021A2640C|nr:hypothetical protein [Marinobacter sp. BGYM27]MDG5501410.1 hypothetical protein [Marinobacter sp. BGYM27]